MFSGQPHKNYTNLAQYWPIITIKVVVCPSIQSVQCILCNKEGEFCLFISELRSRSLAYRYNKVSLTADSTVRNMLKQLAYYNKNKEIVK